MPFWFWKRETNFSKKRVGFEPLFFVLKWTYYASHYLYKVKGTSNDRLLPLTLLKSIHYSLNASLSKRAGRPNFEVDFPSKLLLTFWPKTTIVGNVTGPLFPHPLFKAQVLYSFWYVNHNTFYTVHWSTIETYIILFAVNDINGFPI